MTDSLGRSDRHAIDLVLERLTQLGNDDGQSGTANTVFAISEAGALGQEVAELERVLTALKHMPAHEPPDGMVDRTLQRVDATGSVLPPTDPGLGTPQSA
jgi:hypothetical protein